MELEIKHIAPYLPYELSVQIKYNDRFIFQILRDFAISDLDLFKNQIKPILRPMSDLYKQIENDIENEVTYIEDLSQTCCNKIEYEFIKSIIDSDKGLKSGFIAGANSKFVKEQILLAQIEILQCQVDKLSIGLTKSRSITESKQYTTPEIKFIQRDIVDKIEKLKEQLQNDTK